MADYTGDYVKFGLEDIRSNFYVDEDDLPFTFGCGMVSTCAPLFPEHWSNYEVERDLRKNGVIGDEDKTDTEYSSLYVYFTDRLNAKKFIFKLNIYIRKRAEALAELGFLKLTEKTEV